MINQNYKPGLLPIFLPLKLPDWPIDRISQPIWQRSESKKIGSNLCFKAFVFCCCMLSTLLSAGDQPLLPIHNIEAEHVEFNEKTIHLVGNVKVAHEFGVIRCQEGTLLLRQEKKDGETLPVERILLKDTVSIEFSEGHTLLADEGDIDCATLEGIFLAAPSHVVTYLSTSENGPLKAPLKATSKALKGKIEKTSQGYELTSLRGEGSVHIESLQKTAIVKESSHE